MALSYKEAKENFDRAQKELKAVIQAERANAVQQAKALVKEFGITASELGIKLRTRKAKADDAETVQVAAKYANPADNADRWSGRGRKPNWVKAHLDNGGRIEDLVIKT